MADKSFTCVICGAAFQKRDVVSAALVRDLIGRMILQEHPGFVQDSYICRNDLALYRGRYVTGILEAEKGELSSLEEEVVASLRQHEILAQNVDAEFQQNLTLGERLADRIATFGGSWRFLIIFGLCLALWIAANVFWFSGNPPDPYPFILLNLILSCLAAIQAPVIMMSQNRQETKDRVRSEHDYQVNLKAELEIRHLHEKVDHVLSQQWERLVKIQELQLELLEDLVGKNGDEQLRDE